MSEFPEFQGSDREPLVIYTAVAKAVIALLMQDIAQPIQKKRCSAIRVAA